MSRAAARVEGVPVTTTSLPSGRTLAHLEVGTGAPVALLVPGFTGSKEDFGPVLAPLAAHRAVVAVDLRGQLESPGDGPAESYDPDGLAADLVALVETRGWGQVHLVGHSYGGLVSRALTIARPDLVATLTLLCSGPAAIAGERARLMRAMRAQLVAAGHARVGSLLRAIDGESFDTWRFDRSDPTALLGMGDALLSADDRVDELAKTLAAHAIRCLVACGVDDEAWPPAVQEEMAARLSAAYVLLPDAGHSPAIENPVSTVAALEGLWR